MLTKLLAENESSELITSFLEREKDLLDLSDDIHDLENFYSKQRPTWDNLRNANDQFQLNRKWLDRDDAATAALQRIQAILSNDAPYGMVKEADGLIKTVTDINDKIVEKFRMQALQRIDEHVAKVSSELDAIEAIADLRNQCLYPLQQLRNQVEEQGSVAHISGTKDEAREEVDTAILKIEEAVKKQQGETPGTYKPNFKKLRMVEVAPLSTKTYLETQQDVDEFLEKLRQELEAAIKADERVEIR